MNNVLKTIKTRHPIKDVHFLPRLFSKQNKFFHCFLYNFLNFETDVSQCFKVRLLCRVGNQWEATTLGTALGASLLVNHFFKKKLAPIAIVVRHYPVFVLPNVRQSKRRFLSIGASRVPPHVPLPHALVHPPLSRRKNR